MIKHSAIIKISVLFILAAASGCGDDGPMSDQKEEGEPSGGSPGAPGMQAPGLPAAPGANADQSNEAELPPWLFTLDEARAIAPLVLPLQKSTEQPLPATEAQYDGFRDFIATFLDETMALKTHHPGRDFTVSVITEDIPNAMVLNESVLVHASIAALAGGPGMAMVLCHEMAHSTRNHSHLYEQVINAHLEANPDLVESLDAALNDFIGRNWDPDTEEFHFERSALADVQPYWDAFWRDLNTFNKRQESEADITGGRLCANAGFSKAEVVDATQGLFAKFDELEESLGSMVVEDGIYVVPEDELMDFISAVLSLDSHPTNDERRIQIGRLAELFEPAEIGATAAAGWKGGFAAATAGLSLHGGAHLTAAGAGILRAPASCQHGSALQTQVLGAILRGQHRHPH